MDVAPPSSIRSALAADLRDAPARRRLVLVGVIVWLAYEWGPGNETVTPWLLARLLRDHEGGAAVGVTVAVGVGFTTLQQLLSGFTALAGFAAFRRTAAAAWARLHDRRGGAPAGWDSLGWLPRAALAFGLGTTAVALVEVVTSGRSSAAGHRRAVTTSAVLCGAVVGLIAALTSALVVLGRRVEVLASPTNRLLGILGSPWTWLGLLAAGALVGHLRRRRPPLDSPVQVGQDGGF